jgi:glycosyltransferase involved in cell wall biosynthesis
MSYGDCCVASDIAENVEAIGEHGYTFISKDYKALKRCLKELIENKELIEAKKQDAREHVLRNYSWDSIADRFENFYYRTLAG